MPNAHTQLQTEASVQRKVDLWRAASIELSIGPEAADALVQVGVHAVLALLRAETPTASALLETHTRPHGPLARHLELVGSLLGPSHAAPTEIPRLWWWIVKTAYYRRWTELQRGACHGAQLSA